MTAAISLHLDTLVWDFHVGQLVKRQTEGHLAFAKNIFAMLDVVPTHLCLVWMIRNVWALGLTSALRPMKGMLVSHIATRWASSLLKAHISPDRLGFFGSGSPWSPDTYGATETKQMCLIYSLAMSFLTFTKGTHVHKGTLTSTGKSWIYIWLYIVVMQTTYVSTEATQKKIYFLIKDNWGWALNTFTFPSTFQTV